MKETPMPSGLRHALTALAAVAVLFQGTVVAEGQTRPELSSHRALYTATLKEAKGASGIADVGGTMAMAVEKSCDGWLMTQQLAIDIALANGRAAHQEVRFAAWESLDGLSYRFATRHLLGGGEAGVKGAAKLTKPGGPGTATFEAPARKSVDLPAGTVFPMTHTRLLIDAAEAGKKMDTQILFEGAGTPQAQQVTAFIGPPQVAPDAAKRLGELAGQPAWPVRMAIFDLGKQAAEPSYEIGSLQLANGVVRQMILDLGEFTLKLDLKSIEAIDPPKC